MSENFGLVDVVVISVSLTTLACGASGRTFPTSPPVILYSTLLGVETSPTTLEVETSALPIPTTVRG